MNYYSYSGHICEIPNPIPGASWTFAVSRESDGKITIIAPSSDAPGIVNLNRDGLRIVGFFVPCPNAALFEEAQGDAERLALLLRQKAYDCAGIVLDQRDGTVIAIRSASAVAPLSVHQAHGRLIISNLDRLAAVMSGHVQLDVNGALSFLLSFYPTEPDTLYEGVLRIPCGQVVAYRAAGAQVLHEWFDVGTFDEKFGGRSDLFARYRAVTVEAMRRRIIGQPGLMLSGGIDSVALGVYLTRDLGYADAPAVTFRVKGAHWDESPIAAEAAAAIGMQHDIVEIDPGRDVDLEGLVISSNAPDLSGVYSGLVVDAVKRLHGNVSTLFAGQDTRLHTPWLTKQEMFALGQPKTVNAMVRFASMFRQFVPDEFSQSTNHAKRLAFLTGVAGDLRRLFALRLTKNNFMPELFRREAVETFLLGCSGWVESVLAAQIGPRKQFNRIVSRSFFRSQTPFDGAALRETGLRRGLSMALPYHDEDYVRFCAELPWNEVAGSMAGVSGYDLGKAQAVNKVFLRRSLETDLPPRLLLRAKAVMPSVDVVMSGMLGPFVRRMAEEKGGVLDGPLGRYLNVDGIRHAVARSRDGWSVEGRRVAYVIENITMLDCLVRSR